MASKLEAAGFGIVPLDRWEDGLGYFSPDTIEELAQLEHDRWVEERKQAGWKSGPEKDVARKRTPYLVSWEELSEEVRELDRNAVREIPELLASAHLAIYKRHD